MDMSVSEAGEVIMPGGLLRGAAAIAMLLSGQAQAHGLSSFSGRMRDGACTPAYRALLGPRPGDPSCCVPGRRAVPPLCPRS